MIERAVAMTGPPAFAAVRRRQRCMRARIQPGHQEGYAPGRRLIENSVDLFLPASLLLQNFLDLLSPTLA